MLKGGYHKKEKEDAKPSLSFMVGKTGQIMNR